MEAPCSDSLSTSASSSSSSSSSSTGEYNRLQHNQPLPKVGQDNGDMSEDESYQASETLAFREALMELRGIVGEEPSDDALRDILLAADLDVNRAVNFYFS